MGSIHGDQAAKVFQLLGEGKSIMEIAGTVGLDIGDVQTVLAGAARTFQSVDEAAPTATAESFIAQEFSWLDDFVFPASGNSMIDRPDAVDFVTIPAFTFFAV